ncbi:MAG: ribonuclease R [Pseudomonadota bacterium]
MPRKKTARKAPAAADTLPEVDDVLAFVRGAGDTVTKQSLSKAFGIRGPLRGPFREMLSEMVDDGLLVGNRREFRLPGGLPPVTVLEVTGTDEDGDLIAVPVVWDGEEGPRPAIRLDAASAAATSRGAPRGRPQKDAEIGVGDRVLARIKELDPSLGIDAVRFTAEPIKRLPNDRPKLLGLFRSRGAGGLITPVDRKQLKEWQVQAADTGEAEDGDLVRFDLNRKGRMQVPQARVVEVLGNPSDERQISLIAVHAHGIPDAFPERVLAELDALPDLTAEGREDLTALPLITIDPADARDHDDAVFAKTDDDPANDGGFVVTVAIADVAHYVRPGSALDREAQRRGNSCYFPDRVVPMLPERISNDLCSLREGELRPCLAVEMTYDKRGEKVRHRFLRALMKSHAKLAYEEAQAAFDGNPGPKAAAILENVLRPLKAAYDVLAAARARRAPLALDLPERKIIMGDDGRVSDIVVPPRLDAHKLIEEFMIQANVAAAEALETKKLPVVYRVHEPPEKERLKSLREFLETLDLKLPSANVLKPGDFNRILAAAEATPAPELVSEVVLRAQSQAVYAIENAGHFGLNLRKYAHFTSPIRRYADLLVHRALIAAFKLGDGGLTKDHHAGLSETAEMISTFERRAMAAERETIDRLIAAHLSGKIGAMFDARVSGVTKSGLFVRLNETGADGFVPARSLSDNEYVDYVEELHAMVGSNSGKGYALGDAVEVKLLEAVPMAGALRFEIVSEPRRFHASLMKGYRPRTGRRHRGGDGGGSRGGGGFSRGGGGRSKSRSKSSSKSGPKSRKR